MNPNASGRRRRPNSSPAQRAQWLTRFDQSGLSQQAFAHQHQLNLFTFRKWVEGRRRRPGSAPRAVPPWREVSLGQRLGSPQWIAQVQRPDGWTVCLSAAALPLVESLLAARPC